MKEELDEERNEKKRDIDEIAAAVAAQKVEMKTEIAKEENEANAAAEEDVDKNESTKFLAAFSQQLEEGRVRVTCRRKQPTEANQCAPRIRYSPRTAAAREVKRA